MNISNLHQDRYQYYSALVAMLDPASELYSMVCQQMLAWQDIVATREESAK